MILSPLMVQLVALKREVGTVITVLERKPTDVRTADEHAQLVMLRRWDTMLADALESDELHASDAANGLPHSK